MSNAIPISLSKEWNSKGFVVVPKAIDEELVDLINDAIAKYVAEGNYRTNSKIYSYSSSPRIVEAWRNIPEILDLAWDSKILEILELLFSDRPFPFSTINFLQSSHQPLHSDYVHFGTIPHFLLAAAWVALEDIDPESGPLQVVPGSHKLEPFCYSMLGLEKPRTMGQVKAAYGRYEDWIRSLIEEGKTEQPIVPDLQKGDVLLWHANLLHGSPECKNPALSRKSLVVHYHFESVDNFYSPSFSNLKSGIFAQRIVNQLPNPRCQS